MSDIIAAPRSSLSERFLALPFSRRREIAERIGLLDHLDDCFGNFNISAVWLRRSFERGLNNQVHVAVQECRV